MKYRARNTVRQLQMLLAVFLTALIASSVWANDTWGAQQFLKQLFARYAGPGKGPHFLGKDGSSVFAPELLSLIREDQRRSQGEAGLLDHDPICSCQDFEDIKVVAIQVTPAGRDRAKAKVTFVNGGNTIETGFLLVRQSRQWRILDVEEADVPALRAYLKSGLGKQGFRSTK